MKKQLELSKFGRLTVITADEHGEVEYSKCQVYSPDWEQVTDHLDENFTMYLLVVLENKTISVHGFFKTISKKANSLFMSWNCLSAITAIIIADYLRLS